MCYHLTNWRKAKGLSVKEAADALSVARGTWWRWETGRSKIAVSLLPAVIQLTGLSAHKLRQDIQQLVNWDVKP